jgi:hypothetical protein
MTECCQRFRKDGLQARYGEFDGGEEARWTAETEQMDESW